MSRSNSEGSRDGQDANAQLVGEDENDGDLFGSDSENRDAADKQRKLSDEELDSVDDEGRNDRNDEQLSETKEPTHTREENVLDVSIGRHAIPRSSDGEVIKTCIRAGAAAADDT